MSNVEAPLFDRPARDPRIPAIKRAEELAQDLDRDQVEELFIGRGLTAVEIAEDLLPDGSRDVAYSAVQRVVREAIPRDALIIINTERQRKRATEMFTAGTRDEFLDRQIEAGKARHKPGSAPVNTRGIIEASGKTPWTDEEREMAIRISKSPEFQHRNGMGHDGHPDIRKISEFINATFHEGKNIRSIPSIQFQLSHNK